MKKKLVVGQGSNKGANFVIVGALGAISKTAGKNYGFHRGEDFLYPLRMVRIIFLVKPRDIANVQKPARIS